jgi:type II secretory pathway pseudopilin PulG
VTSRWSADRGETLIELLVAILIMGIAVVAVVGGLLASVKFSDVHRKQATGGADARSYAEAVGRYVAGDQYVECAAPSAYAPATVGFAAPSGFTAAVASVEYWNAGTRTFTGTCSSSGLQRVTVQVASTDGRAAEKAIVVVRKPCGQGASC